MTAQPIEQVDGQEPIDFDAIDAEYHARVETVAGDWFYGDEDYERFIDAVMRSRRGPDDYVSPNDVRRLLTVDTVKGPRIDMNPNRYAALWSRAEADGWIATVRDHEGAVVLEKQATSTTGNNGKRMALRRWVGEPRERRRRRT